MHQYVNSVAPSEKNEYTGLFKGKNLILICAEAFSDQVISKELTPTLYRLTHKGIYFSDFLSASWGGSTSTGEYSFLTGLIPIDGVETIQETRDKLNYYTMGTQLMKEGYHSCAYHNGHMISIPDSLLIKISAMRISLEKETDWKTLQVLGLVTV